MGEVLQDLFKQSEASGSEFIHLPGWDGLEPTPSCASGPGDFKAVFDPDSPGSHTRKFVGFGTGRSNGRRIHSFKIERDRQGRSVICSREHDFFSTYSDGLLIFKGDGLHPGVYSIPGVDLQANEDHDYVMQKVGKLREILQRFGEGDDHGNDLRGDLVGAIRKGAVDCASYWPVYDQKMRSLQPGAKARFSFEALPTTNQGNRCNEDASAWMEALEDTTAAQTMTLLSDISSSKAVKGTKESAMEAIRLAVQSEQETFEHRLEFYQLPGKVLKMHGAAGADDLDAIFDRANIAVGDVVLIRMNPKDAGQDGRPFALGVALHPATKDHTNAHKKGTVQAVFQDTEVNPVSLMSRRVMGLLGKHCH